MMPALPLTGRNRAPETAALAKSRTLPTDGAVAKFLMTILQQLDMKSVNWQEVADEMGVSNGHAARMRFSRLKNQMGFSNPVDRRTKSGSVTKKPRIKKAAAMTPTGDDKDMKNGLRSENQPASNNIEAASNPSVKEENANIMAGVETTEFSNATFGAGMMQEDILNPVSVPMIKEEPSEEQFARVGEQEDGELFVRTATNTAFDSRVKVEPELLLDH